MCEHDGGEHVHAGMHAATQARRQAASKDDSENQHVLIKNAQLLEKVPGAKYFPDTRAPIHETNETPS